MPERDSFTREDGTWEMRMQVDPAFWSPMRSPCRSQTRAIWIATLLGFAMGFGIGAWLV